jgi:hypothetical protein
MWIEPAPASEPEADLESFRDRFSSVEWPGVHSVSTAAVRLIAREHIRRALESASGSADLSQSTIEILTSRDRPGRTPPHIRVSGNDRSDLDLSLSHHGRYLAWALLVPPELKNPAGNAR